jgi:hypothetical protein
MHLSILYLCFFLIQCVMAQPQSDSDASVPGPSRQRSVSYSTTDDEEIKQNPRSAVWKYFKLVRLGENGEEYSVCIVKKATVSGQCGWKRKG